MIQDIKESQLEYFSPVKNTFLKAGKQGLIYQQNSESGLILK